MNPTNYLKAPRQDETPTDCTQLGFMRYWTSPEKMVLEMLYKDQTGRIFWAPIPVVKELLIDGKVEMALWLGKDAFHKL